MRAVIRTALPEGTVVSEHNEDGHWYRVIRDKAVANVVGVSNDTNPLYPSVTGKLQCLKDDGLANYKMNRALDYIFAHFSEFTPENVMEHIDIASRQSADILTDAGDIGTLVHDTREKIFSQWIESGVRPVNFPGFLTEDRQDVRAISCLAALEQFCIDKGYVPVMAEMMVYSHEMKTAGTLDDLGLMRVEMRDGDKACTHGDGAYILKREDQNVDRCARCGAKWKWAFVLVDLKTSNRFKDHYFFQVALYYDMIRKITGLTPEKCFILKLSKEDRTYKMEDLKAPKRLAQYSKYIIKTNEGLDFISGLRKDNQRTVVRI